MARALMRAIPKGEERNAALTRLKDSGEVTPEACANAGWGDGGAPPEYHRTAPRPFPPAAT